MFTPAKGAPAGSTVAVAVLATSQVANMPGGGSAVRIVNRGPGDVALVFNGANQAAFPVPGTAGGLVIAANAPAETITLQDTSISQVSIIGSANATCYLTRGQS